MFLIHLAEPVALRPDSEVYLLENASGALVCAPQQQSPTQNELQKQLPNLKTGSSRGDEALILHELHSNTKNEATNQTDIHRFHPAWRLYASPGVHAEGVSDISRAVERPPGVIPPEKVAVKETHPELGARPSIGFHSLAHSCPATIHTVPGTGLNVSISKNFGSGRWPPNTCARREQLDELSR
jgi:hypothetical protein